MADMTMILPYGRASPLHIPTRDLVVSSADSIDLTVTIVESDDPSAQALVLTGGIGGPACTLLVWPESGYRHWWDYDAPPLCPRTTLWMGTGTLAEAIGSFEIFMPAATMANWPRRCAWAVLLDFDGGGQCEMIAQGHLHVRPSATRPITSLALLTDGSVPILVDG